MSVVVILGGTRPQGNTEILTEKALTNIKAERIYLGDFHIESIIDKRHDTAGFHDRNDDYNSILDRILPHDTIIFATPIYWYSMSGIMKNFIDRWSQSLRDANYPNFKQQMAAKKGYVIAVGGDAPHIKGLPMIQQFQFIFGFIGMEFAGYILGIGNKPGDIMADQKAIYAARELNQLLKTIV